MLSPAQLQQYYDKYGKEKVDEAITFLSYKQEPKPLPKEESAEFPIMYVFRHGQTTDNADMLYSGWRDADLTEKGVQQAEELSEKLKDKNIGMLIASDQIRAIKTMEIAISKNENAKGLEIIKDARIKERCYGDFQGKSKLEVYLEDPEQSMKFRRSYENVPPNGESIEMVVKRVNEFLDEIIPLIKEYGINIAISCHGNSIRGIRQRFEGLTNEETAHIETPLGSDYAAYVIK